MTNCRLSRGHFGAVDHYPDQCRAHCQRHLKAKEKRYQDGTCLRAVELKLRISSGISVQYLSTEL